MRLFEPAQALTLVKLGPDFAYKFEKGNPIGGKTLQDENWMVDLQRSGLLVCITNTNPVSTREIPEVKAEIPKKQGLDPADILPHTKPDIVRQKGYQTHKDFEAKIAVAKAEEKMKAIGDAQERIVYADQDTQDFYDFLVTCKGESEEEMLTSINGEYLEQPIIDLCGKLELDSEGEKSELITRLINWFSLKGYREEDTVIPEVKEEKVFEDQDIRKFVDFLTTLKNEPEEELITVIKGEYTKKPLVALAKKLKLDFDPLAKKADIIKEIISWYVLKGE